MIPYPASVQINVTAFKVTDELITGMAASVDSGGGERWLNVSLPSCIMKLRRCGSGRFVGCPWSLSVVVSALPAPA